MFVRVMTGPSDEDYAPTLNPSWEDVESAIERLDGDCSTLVTIGPEAEGPFLGVGGGAGRYVVSGTRDGNRFFTVLSPRSGGGDIELTCGGQAAGYPRRNVVDLARALEAARVFFERGELSGQLHWESESPQ